jgi:hypothetical protein
MAQVVDRDIPASLIPAFAGGGKVSPGRINVVVDPQIPRPFGFDRKRESGAEAVCRC